MFLRCRSSGISSDEPLFASAILLLDKKRSVIGNVQNLDDATLYQVLSRITALAPVVAQ